MSASSLRLGTEVVPYSVRRSDRRTLGISVNPEGDLLVSAPLSLSTVQIETRLRRRAAWILKTRRDFERLRPRTPGRRYVPGETHRFLGRQYRLAIDPDRSRGVRLDHDYIRVGGIDASEPERVRNRLQIWYQREARRILGERLDQMWSLHGRPSERRPRLVIQPMAKRWGSLSLSGSTLVLNRRLVEADVDAIDFVIVHELCHLAHRDHGPAFLSLLESRMPGWQQRKTWLEKWML